MGWLATTDWAVSSPATAPVPYLVRFLQFFFGLVVSKALEFRWAPHRGRQTLVASICCAMASRPPTRERPRSAPVRSAAAGWGVEGFLRSAMSFTFARVYTHEGPIPYISPFYLLAQSGSPPGVCFSAKPAKLMPPSPPQFTCMLSKLRGGSPV